MSETDASSSPFVFVFIVLAELRATLINDPKKSLMVYSLKLCICRSNSVTCCTLKSDNPFICYKFVPSGILSMIILFSAINLY